MLWDNLCTYLGDMFATSNSLHLPCMIEFSWRNFATTSLMSLSHSFFYFLRFNLDYLKFQNSLCFSKIFKFPVLSSSEITFHHFPRGMHFNGKPKLVHLPRWPVCHLQSIQNWWKPLIKLNIHNSSNDGHNFSLCCCSCCGSSSFWSIVEI